MNSTNRLVTAAVLASALLASFSALADEPSQGWRQTAFIYGMGAAIDGTAQIGNVSAPIDASISDVFSNL